jgi:capsid protein
MTVTRFGAAGALSAVAADVWTESATAKGTYTFSVLTNAAAGTGVIGLNINVQTVTGFTPKNTALFTFTTASLADQVKTLQASVTTLQATVAALTTDYNNVAKKYNKLVKKSKRVALK